MKSSLSLLLAAALILMLTACGVSGAPEETTLPPAAAESTGAAAPDTTEAPAETRKEYPETISAAILVEGEPDRLMMDLFDGGSYVIYIPQNDWTLTTEVRDGLLCDRWSLLWAPEVWLEVISFGSMTQDQALEQLRLQNSDDTFTESGEGRFSLKDPQGRFFTDLTLVTDGSNTFSLMTRMPLEFGDGYAPRFRAMLDSFEIR